MKEKLRLFTTKPLFDATSALLSQLKIEFTPRTKSPISFDDLYKGTSSSLPPKALTDVLTKVSATYYVGTIDTNSLQGHESDFDLENPKEVEGCYQTMIIFAVDIRPNSKLTRGELAVLTRGFNRLAVQLPVILFVRNGSFLTLATCERSEYSQTWRDGEKLGKVSILRDINCETPHRGHIDILESLGDKSYPTFDKLYEHWQEVFSTELLTKKFYMELSEWYAWVVDSGEVKFPNDISTTNDDTKYNTENIIRLITRIIFVWFLKQKRLVPEAFFDEDYICEHFIENFDPHSTDTLFYNPKGSKYYRLILQNLFFAMLNRPIKDEEQGNIDNRRFATNKRFQGKSSDYNINNLFRYKSEFKKGGADELIRLANSQVPFLNGGLFECLDDKDNGMYYDGFSERKESIAQLSFPDYFFFGEEVGNDVNLSKWYDDKQKNHVKVRGLINILKSYNFTVEENTPFDQEVSLDPELLGKVFENLLASYNPETGATARKQTGSFYTPRTIVQYMVDESLIAHLHRVCPTYSDEVIRSLFNYNSDEVDLTLKQRRELISAIHSCKVLDPACGSGAFPMGMLQQMVHILRKLDPDNNLWREFILENSLAKDKEAYEVEGEEERARLRKDIEQSFNKQVNDPDYARKLYLIENCIYGVDIQPIAVQISKLRFFISLVAEQKSTNDSVNNFGIRPLPNLEAKFVAANSLIAIKKACESTQLRLKNLAIADTKKELIDIRHQHFFAKTASRKSFLREKDRVLRESLAKLLEDEQDFASEDAKQLAAWNPYDQNAVSPFFDTEWMFGIADGFDIVIGNPPYVQLQNNCGELAALYENCGYESFARTGDIYCLFYERGWQLLKQDGLLCYITSNKWMRAGYGEKLRKFLAEKTNPKQLIDFAGVKIFESATVDTNILLFQKSANGHETQCVVTDKQNKDGVKNLSDFVQHTHTVCDFATSEAWVILSPIEQSIKRKIEAVGTPLKDWDIQIYRGVLTGCNEAFIISTEKRDEILANCATKDERARTEELIRPILRGRDIKRYGYDWAEKWVILAYFGSYKVIPTLYPAIYAHLLQYEEKLKARGQVRYTSSGKAKEGGDYLGQHHWLELDNNPGKKYLEDFLKPKIVYSEIVRSPQFYLDTDSFFPEATVFIITGENLQYLIRFLNSHITAYLFRKFYAGGGLGEDGYRYKKQFMQNLPIPRCFSSDLSVEQLYQFTPEEINFIESQKFQ